MPRDEQFGAVRQLLDDGIIRYLLTLHERELGAPELTAEELAAASARREQDEDDD